MRGQNSGFSLIEILTVVSLIMIGSTIAVIQYRASAAIFDADKASNLVYSQLSFAREVSVNARRNVVVGFIGDNQIKVTRQNSDSTTTVMSDVTLPAGYTFGLASGVVVNTLDGFGCGSAVHFNSGTSGTFVGNGTFVDASNVLLNGCVFTIGSGNGSARGVTLSGSTGRIKRYWLQSTTWVAR